MAWFAIEAQRVRCDLGDASELLLGEQEVVANEVRGVFGTGEIEEVRDGLERIVDLMSDGGGEAAGHSEFFGTAECLLSELGLLNLIANLVLALAPAEGSGESAEEGFGADGALEQDDVAEGLAELPEALAFGGDAPASDEQDEGEVGPGRLLGKDRLELAGGVALAGLFRDDGGGGSDADLIAEVGDGIDDLAGISGALDDAADELSIAAGGREDDGAGLAGRAFGARGQRAFSGGTAAGAT
jgi:hypothetical protein